jgi:carboxypeptidase Taq
MTLYAMLEERFRRVTALEEATDLLYWDQVTTMPEEGATARGEHLAAINVHVHELLSAPEMAGMLEEAASIDLDSWQRANLVEMRRKHMHAVAVDPALVAALSRAATSTEGRWREAKAASDFSIVKPFLAETLKLVRDTAIAKAEKLGVTPYEALMDAFEPDARQEEIDRLFTEYAAFFPNFLAQVMDRQAAAPPAVAPSGPFSIDGQKVLARRMMQRLGFRFAAGRLDDSVHPFQIGRSGDVRITARYREHDVVTGLLAVIHETGHALYDQAVPMNWRFQPVGKARGTVLHESQALLLEMQVARSRSFSVVLSAMLSESFPGYESAFVPDNLLRLMRKVRPDFIRLGADEVTYPAHVALRYRLERAMIADELQVDDLPEAWNAGMKQLLGLEVTSDRDGCLQDGHWYEGYFGYFPFYSLGAMTAAQLFDAALRARSEIPTEIAEGRLDALRVWLGDHVYRLGSSASTGEILERATGHRLDFAFLKRHLESRYLEDVD